MRARDGIRLARGITGAWEDVFMLIMEPRWLASATPAAHAAIVAACGGDPDKWDEWLRGREEAFTTMCAMAPRLRRRLVAQFAAMADLCPQGLDLGRGDDPRWRQRLGERRSPDLLLVDGIGVVAVIIEIKGTAAINGHASYCRTHADAWADQFTCYLEDCIIDAPSSATRLLVVPDARRPSIEDEFNWAGYSPDVGKRWKLGSFDRLFDSLVGLALLPATVDHAAVLARLMAGVVVGPLPQVPALRAS